MFVRMPLAVPPPQAGMTKLRYTLRFVTPAFLGNARQEAQWRTPPIKALLRQWWRVAWAASHQYPSDFLPMREDEAYLFGHAWLENDTVPTDHGPQKTAARKSAIQLRLSAPSGAINPAAWTPGSQQGVTPLPTGLDTSYAWFGLIRRPGLPDRTAIKPAATEGARNLAIAAPESSMPLLSTALTLASAFGAVGSRCRGGWGSLHLDEVTAPRGFILSAYARPLNACLRDDWAMSLARDERLCLWQSKEVFKSWDRAMGIVAVMRKDVRTSLPKTLRPALGFAGVGRMPGPLRWKIVPAADGVQIRIFAMPHAIPANAGQALSVTDLAQAWRDVCTHLDSYKNFDRWTRDEI